MTFFGQFFDHGLDLVTKGGNGTIYIPLMQDDPLYNKGADGVAGTADDASVRTASSTPSMIAELHGADAGDGIRRSGDRIDNRKPEYHDAVHRSEPDLYVDLFAPGVLARIQTLQ